MSQRRISIWYTLYELSLCTKSSNLKLAGTAYSAAFMLLLPAREVSALASVATIMALYGIRFGTVVKLRMRESTSCLFCERGLLLRFLMAFVGSIHGGFCFELNCPNFHFCFSLHGLYKATSFSLWSGMLITNPWPGCSGWKLKLSTNSMGFNNPTILSDDGTSSRNK